MHRTKYTPVLGLIAAVALLVSAAARAESPPEPDVPEPQGYRTDEYRKPVPKTLAGAKGVLTAEAGKGLMDQAHAVFIDVYPHAPKPPNLPASTVWREPPHRSIKGAVWVPNVGYGKISDETQAFFSAELTRLTASDPSKPIVFFCLRDCWMSWNAAKRAMTMGYTTVYWLPDGSDGWEEAGYDLANIEPLR